MLKIKNLLLAFVLLNICACSQKSKEPEFNEYIEAFTSGTISIESTIKVQLSQPVDDFSFDDENAIKNLFKIKPQIKGSVRLQDDNSTVEFIPENDLTPNTEYNVTFNVSNVIKEAKGDKKTFEFSFTTIEPSFTYKSSIDMSSPNDYNLYAITGDIYTADKTNSDDVEKTLSIKAKEKYVTVWNHEKNTHTFKIDSILAQEKDFYVYLEINGKSIGSDKKVNDTIKIPNTTDFVLLNIEVTQNGENPEIVCTFSHPIDAKQSLKGLISVDGCDDLTYGIKSNKIYVYPKCNITGSRNITIHKGVSNVRGLKIAEDYIEEVEFQSFKPEIKLLSKGGILPNSNGLIIPFQTVMLKAVNVKIIKVYENNIMQFLQVNNITGSREMKRAGRLIAIKTIKLGDDDSKTLRRWNTYSLDLANLITPERGAIYRIEMSFTRSQSLYECTRNDDVEETDFESQLEHQQSLYDYNYSSDYYYYDDYDYYYDYDYYTDPCSNYYYRRSYCCNVLASDIGVIAKIDNMKTVKAAVSNLVTTKPMSDVTVELYNYQQQLVGKGKTSSEGLVEITYTNSKPYLLIAKQNEQRSYLRLDDASSLNMSSFDVSGAVVEKGLKGYIYGERGIWRPGDTLFLNFILNDPNNIIPDNHPVEFTLINPLGQTIVKKKAVGNQHKFFSFTVKTESDAPTGNWMVYAKVGGITFNKRVKIETIKPNRLKIELKIDPTTLASGTIDGTITARWLHGATAKNLETNVNATLSYSGTRFKGYETYYFDDRTKYYYGEEISIYEGRLNEEGVSKFHKKVDCSAPGMVTAKFFTRVFEDGGEFSINSTTEKIIPYKSFVGVRPPNGTGHYGMLETDKEQIYNIICLDGAGQPVAKNKVEVSIYKSNWSWWWSSYNGRWANYSEQTYKDRLANYEVNITDGKGSFAYTAKHNEWGYYYIVLTDKESNHRTTIASYYDWPGWSGAPRQQDGGKQATMLTITADKQKYKVGEKATITFPSSEGSRALVSIESGSKVQQMFWVDGTANETKVNLNITEEMVPNIYVNISLIQPHAQTANDLPIRLYGIIPVEVENDKTILKPKISMPEVLRPEETFKIKISEENNQPMTYTIAIVDDGLLDITNFKTPDAWSTFYAREALGIRSFDIYNLVIGAYGGKIEQLFAIGGGDESEGGDSNNEANRFKPVVKVLGPFTLKGKSNEHSIKLPNYVGSVRAMVVAGNNKAYGAAEKTVPVRKPLMILATLPRVLGAGEEVSLTANVFAMEDNIKNVKVEVKASDIFEYADEKTKSISFKTTGDEFISFKLKTKEKLGIGNVKLIATSGSEKAEYDIEIAVRNANPKIYSIESKIISAGQTWDGTYKLQGMEGTNAVTVEVSTIPPINLQNRLDYLIQYPYGCIEQTTSAAFPQIYLSAVTELSEAQKTKAEENVKAALYRLHSFITSDGGFAYWAGYRDANLWGTSYAGHFIIEAEERGYSVP
ncbi:MAG: Ig-like domain-containing protein, partial [Prevotellaceae bacterium]|nr:Ig-like domain-containing protein [Prevotellaceae bacterium]